MRLLKLALRNLFRNLRRTLITMAAIASGLALVLVMVAMQAGSYKEMLASGISSFAGHVVVQAEGWQEERETEQVVLGATEVSEKLKAAFPDATVTSRAFLGGLLTSPTSSGGVMLRGVDPVAEAAVDRLDDRIVEGTWLEAGDDRGVVLGRGLADALGVGLGDKVVYMGQAAGQTEMSSRLFRVKGIFRTGGAEMDGTMAVTSLAATQELLGRPDAVHQVALHLVNPRESAAATTSVRALVGEPGLAVLEWPQALPELVAFIRVDKVSGDVMMAVMGLIVAMGVLNTLLMSVLERTKEFGVLMSIGMAPHRLGGLILMESLFLGIFGSLFGVLFGAILVWLLVVYGLDYTEMMGESFEMEGVVVSTHMYGAWDVVRMSKYVLATVFVTVLSGVWPAWHLMRLKPVDALRAA
jgi:ABC-type lipoprotein release transport system permease subunit